MCIIIYKVVIFKCGGKKCWHNLKLEIIKILEMN